MDRNIVTEIVEFKVVAGINDEDFIQQVEALEVNFHAKQSGYIDTELSKSREGKWIMIQHWNSMDEVKEVIKLMMKESSTEEFRKAINPQSVKMTLMEQIQTWHK